MPTGTVRLHRILRAPPGRVYRAFLDADAMAKWLSPHGFVGTVAQLDARVGGAFRKSFRNFSNGQVQSFGGDYRALTPDSFTEYTDRFDDPNLPGEVLVRVRLARVRCGTELAVEPSGLPGAIPVETCTPGWPESLDPLARLLEPESLGGSR